MVRKYTDKELLTRVKALTSFVKIPDSYWLLGVRSIEDETDKFDDKFYLWKGEQFIMVTSGTTNKGLKGTAVMKDDMWFYNAYRYGLHRGKMKALRQVKPIPYYRDRNFDGKTDTNGPEYNDIIYMNIHGATYHEGSDQILNRIGAWSEGCQVLNNNDHYEKIVELVRPQRLMTYCLIKEF